MIVLEAATLGVPMVARRIRPLDECPPEVLFDTLDDLVAEVVRLIDRPPTDEEHHLVWDRYLDAHSEQFQRRALLAAYGVGVSSRPVSS